MPSSGSAALAAVANASDSRLARPLPAGPIAIARHAQARQRGQEPPLAQRMVARRTPSAADGSGLQAGSSRAKGRSSSAPVSAASCARTRIARAGASSTIERRPPLSRPPARPTTRRWPPGPQRTAAYGSRRKEAAPPSKYKAAQVGEGPPRTRLDRPESIQRRLARPGRRRGGRALVLPLARRGSGVRRCSRRQTSGAHPPQHRERAGYRPKGLPSRDSSWARKAGSARCVRLNCRHPQWRRLYWNLSTRQAQQAQQSRCFPSVAPSRPSVYRRTFCATR